MIISRAILEGERILRFFKWLFLKSIFSLLFRSAWLQILLPMMAAPYFLVLDVWGSDWSYIKNNLRTHEILFTVLLFLTLVSQLFKAIEAILSKQAVDTYVSFLEEFMTMTASVVQQKLNRFSSCAPKLKPKANTFKIITKPKEQIDFILVKSIEWLRNSFSLGEDQLSITIIRVKGGSDKCYYQFQTQKSWKRTKAKMVVSINSAAAYCLDSGEPVFFVDKIAAAKNGEYYLSERDERHKRGSVYCYPVFVDIPGYEDKYIVTMVTYGKMLCSPDDHDGAQIVQTILREICRRVELELTLLSIRSWQFKD